ncbi:MAG TPA: chemotaxis protein CheD [Wenzhouxiangella sp.]|nr:chemotaxis protein CheD [Wenzhouxiangella sp.]
MKNWPADRRVTLQPGQYHVTGRQDLMLSTLLGSCVAACLYDPVGHVMGMNHFLLANHRYSRDMPVLASEAGRYGVNAMELLINKMLKLGAQRRNLKAKVFGGGNVLPGISRQDSFFAIGDVNSRFVEEFLATEKIPILAKSLGGMNGRMIHFLGNDYSVLVRDIPRTQTIEVEQEEKQFWRKSLKEHDKETKKAGEIDLW